MTFELSAAIFPLSAEIEKQIKENIINAIWEQRQAYQVMTPADTQAVPSEIDIDSWLDAEHVEGTIRELVGIRSYLKKVGVFPVYNNDYIYQVAQITVYYRIIHEPVYQEMLPSQEPLPERQAIINSDLTPLQKTAQIEARDQEEKKRFQQEKALQKLADQTLATWGVTNQTLLLWYLEAIASSDHHFLAHAQSVHLTWNECEQFIIPLRKDEIHYTVVVVHFVNAMASIRYYDSKGQDIPQYVLDALVFLFDRWGYEVYYSSAAKDEQRDWYNCGIFASLKAIELASENVGQVENLLNDLNRKNYDTAFQYYRHLIALLLEKNGFNITLSKGLINALERQQQQVIDSSKQEKIIEDFNRFLNDTLERFTIIFSYIEDRPDTYLPQTNTPLIDLNPAQLLQQCIELHDKMQKKLDKLKKTDWQNKNQLHSMQQHIKAFAQVSYQLKNDLAKLSKEHSLLVKYLLQQWRQLQRNIQHLTWVELLSYMMLYALVLFIGLPIVLSLSVKLATFLSGNSLLIITFTLFSCMATFVALKFTDNFLDEIKPCEEEEASFLFQASRMKGEALLRQYQHPGHAFENQAVDKKNAPRLMPWRI